MTPADQVLFEQWKTRRDPDAFTRLASKYAAMVHAVGRRITGNTHDAEDVAQAAFETLAAQRRAPKVHLGAWLHRVATYRALNLVRGDRRRAEREARYESERPKHAEIRWNDIYDLVDEAIAALPDKQRAVVVAHYLEGKTHEMIARELGISRPAVTQRAQAGVEGIRTALVKRGVTATVTALGGLLVEAASAEVPATLVAQLGRIALAGHAGQAALGIGLWQSMTAAGVAGVVALAGAFYYQQGAREIEAAPPVARDEPAEAVAPRIMGAETVMERVTMLAPSPRTGPSEAVLLASNSGGQTYRLGGSHIHGKVTDVKGKPVVGARVDLLTTENLRLGGTLFTDEDGLFSFQGIRPEEGFVVSADAQAGQHRVRSVEVPITDMKDGSIHQVRLVLENSVIAGRVVDTDGVPLAGVQVVAKPGKLGAADRFRGSDFPSATTDARGSFKLAGVSSGEVRFSLTLPPAATVAAKETVWSDGRTNIQGLEVVYIPPPKELFECYVVDEAGNPIEGAAIDWKMGSTVHRHILLTNAEGLFGMRFQGPNSDTSPHSVYISHPDYHPVEAHDLTVAESPYEITMKRLDQVIDSVGE